MASPCFFCPANALFSLPAVEAGLFWAFSWDSNRHRFSVRSANALKKQVHVRCWIHAGRLLEYARMMLTGDGIIKRKMYRVLALAIRQFMFSSWIFIKVRCFCGVWHAEDSGHPSILVPEVYMQSVQRAGMERDVSIDVTWCNKMIYLCT